MLLGITGFEIRYQLRNPVFWVSVAIFFLIGFGLAASQNVSIGRPSAVHVNAPFAIASTTSILTLFYLFVVTAFVANAIIRDDATGFGPIVRSTSVTARQIVIGRFIGGLVVAWLGYLAVPVGMGAGSVMPWVDAETVGPQNIAYYTWNFAIFAIPNIFLTCAVMFAVATVLRSMMAAYIATVLLVMGWSASGVLGQKIEYREAFARFEPLGSGALREATRYWTQSEMNGRLIDLTGPLLFNRLFYIAVGFAFLAITLWRYTMTERAPSGRRLRRIARREAKAARIAAVPPTTDAGAITARDQRPSRATQFLILAAKAHAILRGQSHVSADDVSAVALPILRHRLITNFTAQSEGVSVDDVIRRLLQSLQRQPMTFRAGRSRGLRSPLHLHEVLLQRLHGR